MPFTAVFLSACEEREGGGRDPGGLEVILDRVDGVERVRNVGEGPWKTLESRTRIFSPEFGRIVAVISDAAGNAMPFLTPERHPPLAALHFDGEGRLWVERTALPGETRWLDVCPEEGGPEKRVQLPPGLDLSYGALLSDRLLGIVRDELDVPYVARFRLEEISTGG